MDSRAWRAIAVTLALFVVVGVILVIGRLYYGKEIEAFVRHYLGGAEREHWGLPAAIAIFTIGAFIGAPQFVLIAACCVAFSPEVGFWYSWIATVASGVITYWMGRFGGGGTRKSLSGATGGRFSKFMSKNAFGASFIVRFVPTAPFIVVNMAMGAAKVNFLWFSLGLTIGVLPKTAIVAFAGDGIMDALEGRVGRAAILGAIAIVVWFFGVFLIRRLVRRDEDPAPSGE
jgi:uncharacterized membrane protein YdjX (TVP38/TMEM64 family)